MGETFFHDPEALVSASDRLRGAGQNMADAYAKLKAVLDEHDGCWGDDEIGEAFAENFVKNIGDVRKGGEEAPTGMDNYSKEMDSLREEFLAQDQNSANNVENTNPQQ